MSVQVLIVLLPALSILVGVVLGAGVWNERRVRHIVERGLYNEVIALRWQAAAAAAEIARRYDAAESFDARFFDLWPLSEPLIYRGTGAANLGYLSRADRVRVTFFHAQLEGARRRWDEARKKGAFEPSPYRVLSGILRAYYEIEPWIVRLKPRLGESVEAEPALNVAGNLLSRFESKMTEPHVAAYCAADCAYPEEAA